MPFGNAHYGGDVRLADDRPIFANYNVIGTDYFRTLGIPLLAGRDFMRVEVESTGAPPVVIISQSLATRLWPEEDPLGRRLELNHVRSDGSRPSLEVVAVVPDLKPRLMERRREPFYYLPLGQDFRPALLLQVRTTPGVDPALLMRQTREELRRLEPQLPVSALSTLKAAHQTGMSVGALRIGARIFGAFGVTALLLAAVGLYGVKAYSVSRRTREIGVRMSLGAATRDVIAMVLWEGARVTGWGVGFGLALAWAAGRLASGFLYDVGPVDYRALSFSVGLLVAAALLACWLPARRAAKVDPMEALRCE
jgi:hypothetical protein